MWNLYIDKLIINLSRVHSAHQWLNYQIMKRRVVRRRRGNTKKSTLSWVKWKKIRFAFDIWRMLKASNNFLYVWLLFYNLKCRIGIVGLPNVGKSSFFNVLSKQQVPAENYPFCTIQPSTAVYVVFIDPCTKDWMFFFVQYS